MKAIITLKTFGDRATIFVVIMLTLFMFGCSSDDKPESYSDFDWNNADISVFVNGIYVQNVNVEFVSKSDSDSAIMVLKGLNPVENIEIDVTKTRYDEDGIAFNGEQIIENRRRILINGLYRPRTFYGGGANQSPMIKMNISYTIPNTIASRRFIIPFAADNGFSYWETVITNREYIDSCKYICKRINSEIGKRLKSMTFHFGEDGLLSLSYITSESKEIERTFRYWIGTEEWPRLGDNKIAYIENGDVFYKFILDALTPDQNKSIGDILSLSPHEFARLSVNQTVSHSGEYTLVISIPDDLQFEIFPYFLATLKTDSHWSDEERKYLNCAQTMAKSFYNANYLCYMWAFISKM